MASGNMEPSISSAEHLSPETTGDNIAAKRVAGYGFDGTNWQRNAPSKAGLVTASYDNVVATRDSVSETFQYRRNTDIVQTVVITYTDASKENIDTIVRT